MSEMVSDRKPLATEFSTVPADTPPLVKLTNRSGLKAKINDLSPDRSWIDRFLSKGGGDDKADSNDSGCRLNIIFNPFYS